MKTLDRFGLGADDSLCRHPMGASSWCSGNYGHVSSSLAGKLGSHLEAPSTQAWGDPGILLCFARDFVVTIYGPRCPLTRCVLHPRRERVSSTLKQQVGVCGAMISLRLLRWSGVSSSW